MPWAVRRGLAERGFAVEKRPGHGRKRERLEARRPEAPVAPCRTPSVAVIGAGIAGAALARAFAALGVRVTVIGAERRAAVGNSGLSDSAQNHVEFGVTGLEAVVSLRKLFAPFVKIYGEVVAHVNRCERAYPCRSPLDAKNLGKLPSRSDLVAGRDDQVVELHSHG